MEWITDTADKRTRRDGTVLEEYVMILLLYVNDLTDYIIKFAM